MVAKNLQQLLALRREGPVWVAYCRMRCGQWTSSPGRSTSQCKSRRKRQQRATGLAFRLSRLSRLDSHTHTFPPTCWDLNQSGLFKFSSSRLKGICTLGHPNFWTWACAQSFKLSKRWNVTTGNGKMVDQTPYLFMLLILPFFKPSNEMRWTSM